MTPDAVDGRMESALRASAAALGIFLAGSIGRFTGALLFRRVREIFGPSAANIIEVSAQRFGETAGDEILDTQRSALTQRLREPREPRIPGLYGGALRQSMESINKKAGAGFHDWFDNRTVALYRPLDVGLAVPARLLSIEFDPALRQMLERLDAQGSALRKPGITLKIEYRTLPLELFHLLKAHFPVHFAAHFHELRIKKEISPTWKEAELDLQELEKTLLARLETERLSQTLIERALASALTNLPNPRRPDPTPGAETKQQSEMKSKAAAERDVSSPTPARTSPMYDPWHRPYACITMVAMQVGEQNDRPLSGLANLVQAVEEKEKSSVVDEDVGQFFVGKVAVFSELGTNHDLGLLSGGDAEVNKDGY